MPDTSIHTFLTPKLEQMVADAEAQGFARDAVVAVLIELADTLNFSNDAPYAPQKDGSPT